jgi:hypothetical protein
MASGLAVYIPAKGAPLRDADPSLVEIYRCVISGSDGGSNANVILSSGDSAAVVPIFRVPDNTMILDVGWRVRTAFTAAVDISMGDSDNSTGWASIAQIDATTADTDVMWCMKGIAIDAGHLDSDEPITFQPIYAGGKYIGSTAEHGLEKDQFPIYITLENTPAGGFDAGLMDVYVKLVRGWDRDFIDRRG